jgi:hypothetical protein
MKQYYNLEDEEFELQFANSSLDPKLFSHEAHIRLAWIHIKKYGVNKAIDNIRKQLQNYVQNLGISDKYNETLTVAAIKTVNHFMQKSDFQTFDEFISDNEKLKTNFRGIIGQHYSFDIFQSMEAKKKYLRPDLLDFT